MSTSPRDDLTRRFLEPRNPTHRQYEALRAHYVDGLSSTEAAALFGYTPASFRTLCYEFCRDPGREFFVARKTGRPPGGVEDRRRERIIELRKANLSIYDISLALKAEGLGMCPAAVSAILSEAGFSKLPRRLDEERPVGPRPEPAPVADARELDLTPREFRTKFGGLFLFMRPLAQIPLEELLARAGFPGSKQIPAAHALRSLLALKLFGNARHSHVMASVFDAGPALFAGLNAIPKRSYLTEYSCRVEPSAHPILMRGWFDELSRLQLGRGRSLDLDFHTIPFHGEDALVQKHYVPKRSRRQKGILAFLAQDAETRVFVYANSDLRVEDRKDEILGFIDYWKERTGDVPEEVVFDSQLTTYENLSKLNQRGVRFMTLRRRTQGMLAEIRQKPASAWRRVELENVTRAFRTPRVLDEKVTLKGYEGPIRQLTIADLGHEEPTILLTNHMRQCPAKIIGRYASRMIIENGIADGIDFFHMDALSSAVAMKVNLDLQLTLMASSLYRLVAGRIGNGYERARTGRLFRDFVDATAIVQITESEICVRFGKRAHNPLLLAADFGNTDVPISWLGGKRLRLCFG